MTDSPPSYSAVLPPPHCCTCALPVPSPSKEKSASSTLPLQQVCCSRWVCGSCIDKNPRFATYCPFCPSSTRILPPSYTPPEAAPPGYEGAASDAGSASGNVKKHGEDVLHFVRPSDTVASLSLLYKVPLDVLRKHNRLFSDHLVMARPAILIPGEYYCGPSLSATPVAGEEEESRKSKIKRFQLRTKCVDTQMAEFYLKEAGLNERIAEKRWWEDEKWAKEHPIKGKGRSSGGRGLGSLRY